jgi:acetyl esterase
MADFSHLPIDPQIQPFMAGFSNLPGARSYPSAQKLREVVRESMIAFPKLDVPLAGIADRTIPGADGAVPVRVYTPQGTGPFPAIAYFHGGGWVVGDLDTQDGIARGLCHEAGAVVVSVHYRLAPEHKFPAGVNDCWAAVKFLADHGGEINADPARLAVAGDSAGGGLANAMALRARDEGVKLAAVLNYYGPCRYPSVETPSAKEFGAGPVLTRDDTFWFWEQYLTDAAAEQNHPWVSPAYVSSLAGIAPTFIGSAELDPSRDDAEFYAGPLRAAGVEVEVKRYPGMIHGFLSWLGVIDGAQLALNDGAAWLKRHWDH